jgi:hypothetical protein
MLRVSKTNPRYFADETGQAVYLSGSHSWINCKDYRYDDGRLLPFDYAEYLKFLESHNFNFIRLWTWDLARSPQRLDYYADVIWHRSPFPWPRTGPGDANDGLPKFDLARFDRAYFDRIRARVIAAGKHGVYVSIMLFNGIDHLTCRIRGTGFPFDLGNNVNGIVCGGTRSQTLLSPAVTAIQEAYVRKVIDTVNDLGNVLYEISNEAGDHSIEWQYHMASFIKAYQATKPNQHPVGITSITDADNSTLFASPADWVSPNRHDGFGYPSEPPAADGRKVVINDTDHSFFFIGLKAAGQDGQREWVWKNFTRGYNTAFMDPYLMPWPNRNVVDGTKLDPYWEVIRANLTYTRNLADRLDLDAMEPRPELASTRYCLANPAAQGAAYVVYLPDKTPVTVDLSATRGELRVEWFDPYRGTTTDGGTVSGGAARSFTPKIEKDAVLYLSQG